jgi:hypothetical protein
MVDPYFNLNPCLKLFFGSMMLNRNSTETNISKPTSWSILASSLRIKGLLSNSALVPYVPCSAHACFTASVYWSSNQFCMGDWGWGACQCMVGMSPLIIAAARRSFNCSTLPCPRDRRNHVIFLALPHCNATVGRSKKEKILKNPLVTAKLDVCSTMEYQAQRSRSVRRRK